MLMTENKILNFAHCQPPPSVHRTAWRHGNANLEWPSVFMCCCCFPWPLLYIGASICIVDTLLPTPSKGRMNRISGWVCEIADCLLRPRKHDHSDVCKANWAEEEITIAIKIGCLRKRKAPQHLSADVIVRALGFVNCSGEGLFVKLLGFILFTPTGKHLVLEWKHSKLSEAVCELLLQHGV